ncbi:hypothetical protein PMPD1_0177 [Paramixta manurensis]|uniref:DUF1158 domain-containing protein n=1 Tax=Paramixta manurensis TaxID=2740817 RepID=A0A6M8UBZ2_9GAMM|nr:hypothetical protein PMPD1_0177 [Erwiniaceae bacterium PD-1]
MKSSLDAFISLMGILMLGFFSALLLPAPSFGLEVSRKLMATFHFQDLNQLYTLVFCLWFLVLGAIEFLVLRFLYRRFIKV